MGILNVTPDSFSDGGQFFAVEPAVQRARLLVQEGADLLDIGGESSRPGALPVSEDQQIARVAPVIRAIRSELAVPISIDTTRAAVASAALDAGADMVNDISAGRDDSQMLPLVASRKVSIILMHMQGSPATMQENPVYEDAVTEVCDFLFQQIGLARIAGIDSADIWVDPGFGFGKTVRHNLQLLNRLYEFSRLGCPLVVGTSRKGFIGSVTGESGHRTLGTAATVAWAAVKGAAVVRVHDVTATRKTIRMIQAIRNSDSLEE